MITAENLTEAAKLAKERDTLQGKIDQAREKFEAEQAANVARVTELNQNIVRLVGADVIDQARPRRASSGSRNGSAGPRMSPEQRQAQVLDFLKAHPKSTVKQMAEHLSVSSPAVYAILKPMDASLKVEQDGRTKLYSAA